MGVDHVNILFLASVEQWNVAIWTYYDIMTIMHLANTIMSGSVSSFLCELFHMFANLRIRLGKCNENRRTFSGELKRNVLLKVFEKVFCYYGLFALILNQFIKLCLIVHLVAAWTAIYLVQKSLLSTTMTRVEYDHSLEVGLSWNK